MKAGDRTTDQDRYPPGLFVMWSVFFIGLIGGLLLMGIVGGMIELGLWLLG